jgi:hypothetical protein
MCSYVSSTQLTVCERASYSGAMQVVLYSGIIQRH